MTEPKPTDISSPADLDKEIAPVVGRDPSNTDAEDLVGPLDHDDDVFNRMTEEEPQGIQALPACED